MVSPVLQGVLLLGAGAPLNVSGARAHFGAGVTLRGDAARRAESPFHARRTMVIRMTLLTTERLVWHCGDRTAEPESAYRGRVLITKICCFLWHRGWRPVLCSART